MIGKGHTCILSIHAMACDAIVRKRLLPIRDYHGRCRKRILLVMISHEDIVLG